MKIAGTAAVVVEMLFDVAVVVVVVVAAVVARMVDPWIGRPKNPTRRSIVADPKPLHGLPRTRAMLVAVVEVVVVAVAVAVAVAVVVVVRCEIHPSAFARLDPRKNAVSAEWRQYWRGSFLLLVVIMLLWVACWVPPRPVGGPHCPHYESPFY